MLAKIFSKRPISKQRQTPSHLDYDMRDLYRPPESPSKPPIDLISIVGFASFSLGVYAGLIYHTQGMKAITVMGIVLAFYLLVMVFSTRR